jgi:hypothetical protein
MQIAFIRTSIYIAKDNLRLVALTSALFRHCIGPRRTKKQRQTTFFGLRPLAVPVQFEYAFNMSQICVLFFVILFVRRPIAMVNVGSSVPFLLPFPFSTGLPSHCPSDGLCPGVLFPVDANRVLAPTDLHSPRHP